MTRDAVAVAASYPAHSQICMKVSLLACLLARWSAAVQAALHLRADHQASPAATVATAKPQTCTRNTRVLLTRHACHHAYAF
jgi:hypothetical protein